MDAGAAFGCFYVAEPLWVSVVRFSCNLAKTMRSFTCEYMTFLKATFQPSSFPFSGSSSLIINSNIIMSTNSTGKTLSIVCGVVVEKLKRLQARTSEQLKTMENNLLVVLACVIVFLTQSRPRIFKPLWISYYANKKFPWNLSPFTLTDFIFMANANPFNDWLWSQIPPSCVHHESLVTARGNPARLLSHKALYLRQV